MPLSHLLEGVAAAGLRYGPECFDEQLSRLQRRREVRDEEVASRDRAAGARHDRAAERGERERQLGGGVGVCHRAADGPAVARDEVADVRQALGEEGDLEQTPVGLSNERADTP